MYGTVVALAWHYYRSKFESMLSRSPRWFLQAALIILSVLLIVVARDDVSRHYHGLVAVTAGFMVLIASKNDCLVTSCRAIGVAAGYVGSRSYFLYLVHMPAFSVVREMILHFGLLDIVGNEWHRIYAILLGLAVSLFVTEFSFRFIEAPLRIYGRRISTIEKNAIKTHI